MILISVDSHSLHNFLNLTINACIDVTISSDLFEQLSVVTLSSTHHRRQHIDLLILKCIQNDIQDAFQNQKMAALARAAGIPTRVEAGLVYLRGRFYYHAWNLVYLGRWVSVDTLFGQVPADVTHIRLVTGSQQQQLDLIGLIGNVKIDVIDYD